jgi:hypothetical protein
MHRSLQNRGCDSRNSGGAESLYEAAARALEAFHQDEWTMANATTTQYLEIIERQPEIRRRLLIRDLEAYVEGTGGNTKQL